MVSSEYSWRRLQHLDNKLRLLEATVESAHDTCCPSEATPEVEGKLAFLRGNNKNISQDGHKTYIFHAVDLSKHQEWPSLTS